MFAEAILALVFAGLLALLLGAVLGVRGPWAATPWALFLVFFLVIWAGGAWTGPVGPAVADVYWVPFLVVGLVLALLVAAAFPAPPPQHRQELDVEAGQAALAVGIGAVFWVLVGALLALVILHYAWP